MTETPWKDPVLREGSALVESLTGIRIPDYRQPLLHAELERIGGSWGVSGGMRRVAAGDHDACSQLISSVAIPETYLFRHFGHFELLGELALRRRDQGRSTRVLSAGCSTGEEAWSAAAVLASVTCPRSETHVVTGWDLCGERLTKARTGRFSKWSCRNGLKSFDEFFEADGDDVVAGDRLRAITSFRQVNLVDNDLPATGVFDAVLFRNVAIYWSDETSATVIERLASLIVEDGLLLVGPSDPVTLPSAEWKHFISNGVRAYRRIPAETPASQPNGAASVREAVGTIGQRRNTPSDSPTPAAPRIDRPTIKPVPVSPRPQPQRADDETRCANLISDPVQACLAKVRKLADTGRYGAAISLLEGHETGSSVEGKLWRGILSLSLEHDREAVRLFRQCVFLRPDVAEFHRWLGVALETVGRSAEAARAHKNAAALDEQ